MAYTQQWREPIKVIADLLSNELELDSSRIFIYNDGRPLPKDKGLYIVISINNTQIFRNTDRFVKALDFMDILIPEAFCQLLHISRYLQKFSLMLSHQLQKLILGDAAHLISGNHNHHLWQKSQQRRVLAHTIYKEVEGALSVIYCVVKIINIHYSSILYTDKRTQYASAGTQTSV